MKWASLALILPAVFASAPALAGTPDGEDLEGVWVGKWNEPQGEMDGTVRVYVSQFMDTAIVEYFLDGNPFGQACATVDSGDLRLVRGEDFNKKKIKYAGENPSLGDMKLRTKKSRLVAKGPAACAEDGPEWKGRGKLNKKKLKGKAKLEFPDGEERQTKFSAKRIDTF